MWISFLHMSNMLTVSKISNCPLGQATAPETGLTGVNICPEMDSYSGVSPGRIWPPCSDNQCLARTISAEKSLDSIVASFQLWGLVLDFDPCRENHQNHHHLTIARSGKFRFCQSKSHVLISSAKSEAV